MTQKLSRIGLAGLGLALGVGLALLLRGSHSPTWGSSNLLGQALAADVSEPSAVCNCADAVADANTRLQGLKEKAAELQGTSPGLILLDADGNEIGKIMQVFSTWWFRNYLVFHTALQGAFTVHASGTVQNLGTVKYTTENCEGQAYGGPGLSGDAAGHFYRPEPGAESVEVAWKSVSKPYGEPCKALSGATYWSVPLMKLEQPFPMPLKMPLSVK